MTSVREEVVFATLRASSKPFNFTEAEWEAVEHDIETQLTNQKQETVKEASALALNISAIDERLTRLTDAYVDQLVERDIYLSRKAALLDDKATFVSRKTAIEGGDTDFQRRVEKNLELIKTLGLLGILEDCDKTREILKSTTSNLIASPKNLYVAWRNPFLEIANRTSITLGGPYRGKPRTFRAHAIARAIMKHSKFADGEDGNPPPRSI